MTTLKRTISIAVFTFFAFSLFAQIGVRAGITLPNQSVESDGVDLSFDANLGFTFAAIFEIAAGENFAVQPEIAFVQKGFKESFDFFGVTEELKLRLNYVDVPVLAKYKFGNESVAAYVAAGPTFGYAVSGSSEEAGEKESFDDDDWDGFNRFEIGASAGGGIGIPTDGGLIFLDFRYLFSLNNLYDGDDSEDIKGTNKGVNISVGYQTAIQ